MEEGPSKKRIRCDSLKEELPSMDEVYEKDLPLMANVDEVHVSHYVMKLEFDMENKIVRGRAILLIKSVDDKVPEKVVLDACAIDVSRVIALPKDLLGLLHAEDENQLYSIFNIVKEGGNNRLEVCLNKKGHQDLSNEDGGQDLSNQDSVTSDFGVKAGNQDLSTSGISRGSCQEEQNQESYGEDKCAGSCQEVTRQGSCQEETRQGSCPEETRQESCQEGKRRESCQDRKRRESCQEEKCQESYQEEKSTNLNFSADKWSLTISGWKEEFPCAILIEYVTTPSTPSLHWRPIKGFDFDEAPICCYTPAAPVNNRGLFPCQEPPSAMATWQCFVQVMDPYLALLSSDNPGKIVQNFENSTVQYFKCTQMLPMSTFSIVVSIFDCKNIFTSDWVNDDNGSPGQIVPIRWIYQTDVEETFALKCLSFTESILTESHKILGTLPFQRLDIVLMPDCFPTLGLANPNMIFLSPSLMTGRTPLLYSRIAHEIGHFWFGLSIGALDWTEEWLSEGFATFAEDVIYKNVIVKEDFAEFTECLEQVKLRPLIRLITLQHEIDNTSSQEDLQYLQPNSMNVALQQPDDEPISPGGSHHVNRKSVVINGLEPMKEFMQVHYIKGYFCLKLLSEIVGEEEFLRFLHQYVQQFQGKLVTSEDFLNYFKSFCSDCGILNFSETIDSIAEAWLRQSKIPEPYEQLVNQERFSAWNIEGVFPDCVEAFEQIRNLFLEILSPETSSDDMLDSAEVILHSAGKQILLELILSCETKLPEEILDKVHDVVTPDDENPEVLHRWCELIIKCKCKRKLLDVRNFLLNHPAMGIYLYGELMISEKRSFQILARKIFYLRRDVLDPPHLQMLETMIL